MDACTMAEFVLSRSAVMETMSKLEAGAPPGPMDR
jgi:hypothetical protein